MEVEEQETNDVEVQAEVEEVSFDALKEKAQEINNHEPESPVVEEVVEEVAEAKPATTEEVATESAEVDAPSFAAEFKYTHKGQELEVDEFLRPLITSEESQKKIQEISQKLSFVEDTKEIRQKWDDSQETLQMVGECQRLFDEGTEENDLNKLERLVETIGLSDDQLFNIAKAKLDRRKMEPAVRQQHEKQNTLALENERLVRENQEYQSSAMAASREQIGLALNNQLERPDIQDVKRTYEAANGEGSFRDLLINQGNAESIQAGKTVPPNVVMENILKYANSFRGAQAASPTVSTPQVNQQPKKVVTNVSSTGTSPSRSTVNSLDDIRRITQERFGD